METGKPGGCLWRRIGPVRTRRCRCILGVMTTSVGRDSWLRLFAPLAVPALALGLSFGVVASQAGLGVLAATLMSATTYAGSAQFAAVTLFGAGAGIPVALTAASLLNVRYLPMGIAVAPWFGGPWWRRFGEAQMIVDESWILAQQPGGGFDKGVMHRIALSFLAVWVTGTALGAHFGSGIGSLERFGLDAIVPAMFLGLLVPRLREPGERRVSLAAALIALATTPVAPPGVPVLLALGASLLGRRS